MQSDPRTAPMSDGQPRIGVRPATQLMRDILDTSRDFQSHLRAQMTVNSTDLDAMEYLIMSGPSGPTELARHLGVTTAAATTVVDRLVALGHAERTKNLHDRRGVVVTPSPTSVAQAMGHIMPMVRGIDEALNDFTADEQAVITRYLADVLSSYRAQLPMS